MEREYSEIAIKIAQDMGDTSLKHILIQRK